MPMRLPRVRLRLWWLLVAVAVVGIGLGLWRRRVSFLAKSRHYAVASTLRSYGPPPAKATEAFRRWEKERDEILRKNEHLLRLAIKYEYAADHPWLPVSPDPPPPD